MKNVIEVHWRSDLEQNLIKALVSFGVLEEIHEEEFKSFLNSNIKKNGHLIIEFIEDTNV